MAASSQDALESIERRRAQLQENVDKLRKALSHWTTWEAEYQMLKEEIQAAEEPSASHIREIARNLDGTLVNEKEVEELLGKNSQPTRSANAVVDLLSRRIDYVQQNSATIEKQLDAAEKQLAGADILLEPGMENEEGLPMMDIEEELDEEGNEVSSSVNQTGEGAAEVVEVLRRAGLQKAELEKKKDPAHAPEEALATPPAPPSAVAADKHIDVTSTEASSEPVSIKSTTAKPEPFAENIEHESAKKSALELHGYNDDLAATNFSNGTKVIELDDDDNTVASYPIIPQGESPEDAELRRQMLQYGLSEVGQIVAELDLDRPTVSYSDDEDDYDDYNTEEEEEEDEYGRSAGPIVTEQYRNQMLELEQRLGARMLENVGPQPDAHPLAGHIGDVRTMRVRKDEQFDQSLDPSKLKASKEEPNAERKKKGVRFADDVDISEAPQPVKPAPTMSDTVLERATPTSQASAKPSKPAKVSRFKSARAGSKQAPQTLPITPVPVAPPVPSGPIGRTLASTIAEHTPSPSQPLAPDEFDPITLNREIHAEYHKARNKFIQQQSGFKPTEEDEESPIVEERDGNTKKVSRFMAARLKADGM